MYKLSVLLLFASQIALCQIPYYDALKLVKLNPAENDGKLVFPIGNHTQAAAILKNYTSGSNYGQIRSDFSTNKFIALPNDASVSTNNILGSSGSLAKIGGVNVTNIADGLAKFLVDRTKQELSVAFFQKFKKELDNSAELKILFPQTKKVLEAIGDEIYMYANYINSLKEAFDKDMDNILVALQKYVQQEFPSADINEPIIDALYLTNLIKNGEHPGEATNLLAGRTETYNSTPYKKFRESLAVLNAFSQSLRFRTDSLYWVPSDSLNLLFEKNTFQIYLGLMYQQYQEMPLLDQTFGDYLEDLKEEMSRLIPPIRALIKSAEKIDLSVRSIKNKTANNLKIDSYFEVFAGSTDFISKFSELIKLSNPSEEELSKFDKYVNTAALINEIYLNINEKKYNSLVINLFALGDVLKIERDGENVFGGSFLKYGSFMANVAQSESSDDVQAAIEAIALPVGSASIKKESHFNFALNAYVGGVYGDERLNSLVNNKSSEILGVFAPVGLNFSHGLNPKLGGENRDWGSISLFASLVDVGAVTAFRFQDDSTENLPEIKLENIFAPGLHVVWGVPKVPISIGYTLRQYGPNLREITTDDSQNTILEVDPDPSFRTWAVFIAVDIPLLNFFTASR